MFILSIFILKSGSPDAWGFVWSLGFKGWIQEILISRVLKVPFHLETISIVNNFWWLPSSGTSDKGSPSHLSAQSTKLLTLALICAVGCQIHLHNDTMGIKCCLNKCQKMFLKRRQSLNVIDIRKIWMKFNIYFNLVLDPVWAFTFVFLLYCTFSMPKHTVFLCNFKKTKTLSLLSDKKHLFDQNKELIICDFFIH